MRDISLRQETILSCVVETHIETAAPVGSNTLRERYHMDYSPATLRHEMGSLEERGYLTHPHTSSGRVPTDRGYRYYVDHAVEASAPAETFERVEGDLLGLSRQARETESLMEDVSRLVSACAREASFILIPNAQGTSSNRVRLYLQGSMHILDKPEFQDVSKVRNLFRIFEEKSRLAEWISSQQSPNQEVSIRIGQENKPEAFHDCSVISAQYDLPEGVTGTIAIVGPKRMRYSQTIPLVSRMAGLMKQILDDRISG